MALEKIVQEVRNHGQEEARRIQKDTGKQVLAILNRATREVEAMMKDARSEAEQEAIRLGTSQVAAANLDARKRVLKSKADMLQKVRDGVMARLESLPIIQRERFIRKLLARARKFIPEGTVCVRSEDQDILRDNLGGYRMGPPVEICGGIIVDSLDRKRRLDLSFETLFEDTWERNFSEISHLLFGEVRE